MINNKNNDSKFTYPYGIWYMKANATNDGNILANKTFHVVFSIIKTDLQTNIKKVIGILYNQKDEVLDIKENYYYFMCSVPLSQEFNLEYVLKNVVYNREKEYSSSYFKKIMFDDSEKKKILIKALEILKSKINNNR